MGPRFFFTWRSDFDFQKVIEVIATAYCQERPVPGALLMAGGSAMCRLSQ